MFYFILVGGVSPKSSTSKPIFEAESPDELALVQMAFNYNCKLLKRTPSKAIVSLPGMSVCFSFRDFIYQ